MTKANYSFIVADSVEQFIELVRNNHYPSSIKIDLKYHEELFNEVKSLKDQSNKFLYCYGNFLYDGIGCIPNKEEAFNVFMSLLNTKESAVYNSLALCYFFGHGVEKNYEKSLHYFNLSVELDDPVAMINLSICYEKGDMVSQDYNKAFELINRAIELNYGRAYCNLATYYEKGIIV